MDALHIGTGFVGVGAAMLGGMHSYNRAELAVVMALTAIVLFSELVARKDNLLGDPFRYKSGGLHMLVSWGIVTLVAYNVLSGACV
mgnify:CR=1 FL=1